MGDPETDYVFELYCVPITGGPSVRLNAPLLAESHVGEFQISPDGSRVVYGLDHQYEEEVRELYSVPLTGGASVKLGERLDSWGYMGDFQISPDGSRVFYTKADRVVYTEEQGTYGMTELYSVPIAGGDAVKLDGAPVDQTSVTNLRITPSGGRVVYSQAQWYRDLGIYYQWVKLFSVPSKGGAAVKLNGKLAAGGHWEGAFRFQFSPDGSRVVFRATQPQPVYVLETELYSVPTKGGAMVKLGGRGLVWGWGSGYNEFDFQISPDGSRVVYWADQDKHDRFELYSVPITGGNSVKLNGKLVAGGDVGGDVSAFQITPGGSWVVYLADQDKDDVPELYATKLGFTTLTSFLGDGPNAPRDSDMFRFRAKRGERVAIRVEKSPPSKGQKAALTLTGQGLSLRKAGTLPREIIVTLPRAGLYTIQIDNMLPSKRLVGNCALTLESSKDAWKTLVPATSVE
jgi:hypothetical protein